MTVAGSNIQLEGQSGAQIISPAAEFAALTITDAVNVGVTDLVITAPAGAGHAVFVARSQVDFARMTLESVDRTALSAWRGSEVGIHSSTMQLSTIGVDVQLNSHVTIGGGDGAGIQGVTQIKNNSDHGIRVAGESSVQIRSNDNLATDSTLPGSTVLVDGNGTSRGTAGIRVDEASRLVIEDQTPSNSTHVSITNNGGVGISAVGLSRVDLENVKVEFNAGGGLSLSGISFADVEGDRRASSASMTINSNTGIGVDVRDNSVAKFNVAEINDNTSSGIFVQNNSILTLTRSDVISNDLHGIFAETSALVTASRTDVNQNVLSGIFGRINATITLRPGTHIDGNFQDGIHLETQSLVVVSPNVFATQNVPPQLEMENSVPPLS